MFIAQRQALEEFLAACTRALARHHEQQTTADAFGMQPPGNMNFGC
jgi:hypothetical protein